MSPRSPSPAISSGVAGNAGRAALLALLRAWVRWAARSAIAGRSRSRSDPTAGRFTREDLDRLLSAAWGNFDRLSPQLQREPTLGSRQNHLDYPLARMWGGELERHGTPGGGARRCDFRFRAPGPVERELKRPDEL
jgi:hypothetical protein